MRRRSGAADSFEASGEHAKGAAALTCAQPLPRVRNRAACPPKRRLSIRRRSFSKPPPRWDSKGAERTEVITDPSQLGAAVNALQLFPAVHPAAAAVRRRCGRDEGLDVDRCQPLALRSRVGMWASRSRSGCVRTRSGSRGSGAGCNGVWASLAKSAVAAELYDFFAACLTLLETVSGSRGNPKHISVDGGSRHASGGGCVRGRSGSGGGGGCRAAALGCVCAPALPLPLVVEPFPIRNQPTTSGQL